MQSFHEYDNAQTLDFPSKRFTMSSSEFWRSNLTFSNHYVQQIFKNVCKVHTNLNWNHTTWAGTKQIDIWESVLGSSTSFFLVQKYLENQSEFQILYYIAFTFMNLSSSRSVNFKRTFWCHRLDPKTIKIRRYFYCCLLILSAQFSLG